MKSIFKKVISFILIAAMFGVAGFLVVSKTDLLSFFMSKTHTVTFDANGGTFDGETVTEIEVDKNGFISLPEVSREGYNFDGWCFGDIIWDDTRPVKKDIDLVAKWIPKQYKITFVVDGVSHERMLDYDSMPVFNGNTAKTPTNTVAYVFNGWSPALEVVKGEATYTATYSEILRKYKIELEVLPEGLANVSGAGQFEWLTSTTIAVDIVDGYELEGWYVNGHLYSTDETFTLTGIDEDYTFVAKIVPKKYKIKFIVDGVSHERLIDYNSMPEFDGDTIKSPSNTKTYTFKAWQPALEVVKGEATYTATYDEFVRKYSVNVQASPASAGSVSGAGQFEYHQSTSISVVPIVGYELQGWYLNDEYYSSELSFDFNDIEEDCTFVAKLALIKYKITFIVDGVPHEQMIEYGSMPVFDGSTEKAPTNTVTYVFNGWTPALEVVKGEATYTATYSEIVRKFNVNATADPAEAGTISGTGKFEWLEDTVISIVPNDGFTFEGWFLSGELYSSNLSFELNDIDDDYDFVAKLVGDERTVAFSVDGMALEDDTIESTYGEIVSEPEINTTKYGMSGYKIVGWYLDEACTNKYTFGEPLLENVQLYGKWEYMMDNGFYPYLTKFNNAKTYSKLSINSMTELVAWVEFIQFYNITTQYPLSLNFSHSGIMNTLSLAIDKSRYPSNGSTAYSQDGKIYMSSSYRAAESNLKNADSSKTYILPQQDFAYELGEQTSRADSFDSFNIKNVAQTLQVETSNQLVYALEVGLEPICKSGSPAESVMSKAKQVLRDICTNEMDELTKLRAIYEWLVLNVAYDNAAADYAMANVIDWQEYDAWYAEGVFNNGKAVCDGLAKAFLILAKLENIPTIRVSGISSGGVGHAWNKVYLNGEWYGVDTTHGSPSVGGEFEILTYTNFLFTDSFKQTEGYTQTDYADIVADAVFNIYDEVSYNNSGEFDWIIDNNAEFVKLLQYVKNYQKTDGVTYYSVEVVLADGLTLQNLNSYASMYGVGINSYVKFENSTIGKIVYSLLIA